MRKNLDDEGNFGTAGPDIDTIFIEITYYNLVHTFQFRNGIISNHKEQRQLIAAGTISIPLQRFIYFND